MSQLRKNFSELLFVPLPAYFWLFGGWRSSRSWRTFGFQNRHADPGRGNHFYNARYSISNQANLETFNDEAGIVNDVLLVVEFLNRQTKATVRLNTNRNVVV